MLKLQKLPVQDWRLCFRSLVPVLNLFEEELLQACNMTKWNKQILDEQGSHHVSKAHMSYGAFLDLHTAKVRVAEENAFTKYKKYIYENELGLHPKLESMNSFEEF